MSDLDILARAYLDAPEDAGCGWVDKIYNEVVWSSGEGTFSPSAYSIGLIRNRYNELSGMPKEMELDIDPEIAEKSYESALWGDQPTWNGEGLPPVGTACEVLWNYDKDRNICEYVTGVYLGQSAVEYKAVFELLEGEDKGLNYVDTYFCDGIPALRPIKTEREKCVEAMCKIISPAHNWTDQEKAEALYDAGYRKVKDD